MYFCTSIFMIKGLFFILLFYLLGEAVANIIGGVYPWECHRYDAVVCKPYSEGCQGGICERCSYGNNQEYGYIFCACFGGAYGLYRSIVEVDMGYNDIDNGKYNTYYHSSSFRPRPYGTTP